LPSINNLEFNSDGFFLHWVKNLDLTAIMGCHGEEFGRSGRRATIVRSNKDIVAWEKDWNLGIDSIA
jgi:hypothetical protein